MTHEQNLLYAGMIAAHLHTAGVRIRPQRDNNGNYTGEIYIMMDDGLHVRIKVVGFYQEEKPE